MWLHICVCFRGKRHFLDLMVTNMIELGEGGNLTGWYMSLEMLLSSETLPTVGTENRRHITVGIGGF